MELKQLENLVAELRSLLEDQPEFTDMYGDDMEKCFKVTAQIITIFENDKQLEHLVLGNEAKTVMLGLKDLAVTMHKAAPHKKAVEDMLGGMDFYQIEELVETLDTAIGREED